MSSVIVANCLAMCCFWVVELYPSRDTIFCFSHCSRVDSGSDIPLKTLNYPLNLSILFYYAYPIILVKTTANGPSVIIDEVSLSLEILLILL